MDPGIYSNEHVFENRSEYWKGRHALSQTSGRKLAKNLAGQEDDRYNSCASSFDLSTTNLKRQEKAISEQIRHCRKCYAKELEELHDNDGYLLGKSCVKCTEFMPTVDDTVSLQEVQHVLASIEAAFCDKCDNTDVYQYTFSKISEDNMYHIHCEKCGTDIPINHKESVHASDMFEESDLVAKATDGTLRSQNHREEHSLCDAAMSGALEEGREKVGWYEWLLSFIWKPESGKDRKVKTEDPTQRQRAAKKRIHEVSGVIASMITDDFVEQIGLDPKHVPKRILRKVIAIAGEKIYASIDDDGHSEGPRSDNQVQTSDRGGNNEHTTDTDTRVSTGESVGRSHNDEYIGNKSMGKIRRTIVSNQTRDKLNGVETGEEVKEISVKGTMDSNLRKYKDSDAEETSGRQTCTKPKSRARRVVAFGYATGVASVPYACRYAARMVTGAVVAPFAPCLAMPASFLGEMAGKNLGEAMMNYLTNNRD